MANAVALGTASATAAAYDPSGGPTTLPDGTTQSFNADDQVTASATPTGVNEAYGYNPTGDRTTTSSAGGGPISAVGPVAEATGGTLAVSPATAGDLMVLTVSTSSSPAPTVTSVSGAASAPGAWPSSRPTTVMVPPTTRYGPAWSPPRGPPP